MTPTMKGRIVIYAIPCQEEAHDLLRHLFGKVPEYLGDEQYMLFDPKNKKNNRQVHEDELYNAEGTMYAIDNLVQIIM